MIRLRTYYIWAILAPLVVFAMVAAAGAGDDASMLGLGPGASIHWLYPRSAVREVLAYAIVASWLLWGLHHRTLAEFQQAVWRAPVVLALIHILFPMAVILAKGAARAVVAEQGGRILVRALVRLLMGFGYVALVQWVRRQLELGEAPEAST